MDTSVTQAADLYHFFRFINEQEVADFDFVLPIPLNVKDRSLRLILRQCVLPVPQVWFEGGFFEINNLRKDISSCYVSSLENLINIINQNLPSNIPPLTLIERANTKVIKLVLPPSSYVRVSENIAALFFNGITQLTNDDRSFALEHLTKVKNVLLTRTYYLSSNLIRESVIVGNVQIPLLNTLVVNDFVNDTECRLLWRDEISQGESYLTPGYHRKITLQIYDHSGELIRLKRGVFFVQLKLCT